MTKDDVKTVLTLAGVALLFIALVTGGITCTVKRWGECRRIHPWWYCIGEDGK